MRLALRRGASEQDAVSLDGPVAAFAGIFDGHVLWVAVTARPGRLTLRHVGTGQVVDVPFEEIDDQPAYLGARLELDALDGEQARYDVLLVPPDGTEPLVLTTPPLPPPGPGRPSADGRTLHTLVCTPEQTLRVRTTLLPAAAGLLAVRKLEDAVELTLTGAGPALAVLTEDEEVIASWPVDDRGVVMITGDSVRHLEPLTRPAMTGRVGAWQPVRRLANDLLDPRAAAPLPQLDHPDDHGPRLRLPWSRDALLLVRVFALDEQDG